MTQDSSRNNLSIKLVGPVVFLMYMQSLLDVHISPDTVTYARDYEDYDYVVVITFSTDVQEKEVYPTTRLSSDKVFHVKYPYSINVLLAMHDLQEFVNNLFTGEGDADTYGWY